jgi:hypothetical protein
MDAAEAGQPAPRVLDVPRDMGGHFGSATCLSRSQIVPCNGNGTQARSGFPALSGPPMSLPDLTVTFRDLTTIISLFLRDGQMIEQERNLADFREFPPS